MPLTADTLLENLELLERAVTLFRTRCIELLAANRERCAELLDGSCAFAMAAVSRLGYDRVARIIEENRCDPEKIREDLEKAQTFKPMGTESA
jgi:aspartate ammonia-lyase